MHPLTEQTQSLTLRGTPYASVGNGLSIAFVATCPPRQCGIATFSRDLEQALLAADPSTRIVWAAINEATSIHPYGPKVHWRIRQGDPESYRAAAEQLNAAAIDVVSLQHEFGLYGNWADPFEDHLSGFLDVLRKPLVTTLHSVLPEPSPSIRASVRHLAQRSGVVVVMAERARTLLIDDYGIAPARVQMIPHGVPPIEPRGRTRMKEQLGLTSRTIVTTFGLVDPRKGLEYMIEAMPAVRSQHPDALYLIVGKTHPELIRRDGEAYRQRLWRLVRTAASNEQVAFVDEYLTQTQIVDYLLASDVYVTPYLDPLADHQRHPRLCAGGWQGHHLDAVPACDRGARRRSRAAGRLQKCERTRPARRCASWAIPT